MIQKKYFIFVNVLLFSFCLCEISVEQKEKLLNGFIDYYNNLPNQIYTCDERSLQNTQQVDDTTYHIVANLKLAEIRNIDVTKLVKCTATVQDSNNEITVTSYHCQEHGQQNPAETGSQEQAPETQVEVTEPTVEREPVKLENEVHSDTTITSGEQFIAIPRDQPSAPCVGCTSHVNPQAAGVSDLANLGVRHLDIHEPSVKHSLNDVIDVERQVQVVNGVRYILTLSIKFNNCNEVETDNCASSKTCKITILVKPWVKLPTGANYRAILGNNCTEEWQYGDNGEVLPEPSTDKHVHNADDIEVKHNVDVQSQPNQERSLTDGEIKNLQDQIIPNSHFQEGTDTVREDFTISPDTPEASKQHVFKVESGKHNENSIPVTNSGGESQQTMSINPDKKKAIDEMLDFFDFSGFQPKTNVEEIIPRVRRSYDYDLQVLSLAEEFHGIKKSLENARLMYQMAQAMVDYLNEMDMEVKNRAVQHVIKAEEEIENLQHFVYVQALVTIPCDKLECEPRDAVNQICNGVIDSTNEKNPQILNTFCYNDNKERDYRDVINEIAFDDPVLQKLVREALKKIESESTSQYALKINKIVSATTQVTSGRLTKFSVVIDSINCNKSVPLALRVNCTVLEQLGSKICEIIIHERHWLKERKISYICTDRPVDMRISKSKSIIKNVTVDDPKIIEMLQEAIQYLETQSDKNNKQKIVNIKSISSQIIAGFLTKIEFVVGYTNCTDENYSRDESIKCELVNNEGLRLCKAQIWDRSWIMDGRQVEVSCEDVEKSNEIEKVRKKRSVDFVGGQLSQSVNDINLEYIKLAQESLKRFLHSSSSRQHYKVVKVDKVTAQDVPGKLTKIEFSISPTNCLNKMNSHPSSSKCEVVNPKKVFRCRSKILERIWLDKTQYFVNCNIKDQEQQTKSYSNGLKEHNPNDAKYYKLAEESLNKYLNDSGKSSNLKIIRVEKVTTKTVSGLLTSIDFIVSNQNEHSGSISCHSNILEKRWLGSKNYNVSCQMQENKNANVTIELKDNPKYMQIAVESLQKYLKYKPDSQLVRVTFVDKVIKVGDITKIFFIASHTEDDDGDTVCTAEYSEHNLLRSDIQVKCHLIGTVLRKSEIGEEDSTFSKYVKLADESLNRYLQTMNISQLYTIMNIENVTIQWEGGIKTVITFIVSPFDLDNSDVQVLRCVSKIAEQPWVHQRNIDVKCEENTDLYRTKRQAPNEHRVKRGFIAGGLTEQNPADLEYKKLAEESLKKYVLDSGTAAPLTVVEVLKVTTQVVAGSLTRIDFLVSGGQGSISLTCHSEVWDRPWLNKKEINVTCDNDEHRVKREVLVGGLTAQNPADLEYKKLAEESLKKYVLDSGTAPPLTLVKVLKVTTQVVAGSLTDIDFLVSGGQESKSLTCHSKVWDRPWLNKKEIEVTCDNDEHRVKREVLVGGLTAQNPADLKYKTLAEESLKKYVLDSGTAAPLTLVEVLKVTTQVVAGSLTRIDFLVYGGQGSISLTCHSEIWDRPWLNKKEIDVTCDNDEHRVKREVLVGGLTAQNPADLEYKKLAEESLKKYVLDSGTAAPLTLVKVLKVTTQVVAGSLTDIDFLVSGGQESKSLTCHSKVWDRPWLNKKEIDVTCDIDEHVVKRQLPGGPQVQDSTKPDYKKLSEESLSKNLFNERSRKKRELIQGKHPDDILRGRFEETEDPNKPEYKIYAEESLRKYEQKHSIYHKVIEVKRVLTRVVSGIKYKIDFTASPTTCSVNVTNVFARSCQPIDDITLYCHTEIWDRPWLKSKKIDIQCHNPDDDDDFDEYESENEPDETPSDLTNNNNKKYKLLAEEASEKYLTTSNRKYVHKVTKIHSASEQIADGTITKIQYSLSPTTCLRNETRGSNDSCKLKTPLVVFHCDANIWDRPWLHIEKEIKVTCKKNSNKKSKKHKRDLGDRTVRQIGEDEDEMDEDVIYYYADRAVQHVNDQSNSNNLHKLITIHAVQTSVQMGVTMVRMYIDIAETFCLRHHKEKNLNDCEEMDGLNHRLCLARLWPSPDDELVVRHVSVVCDDDRDFESITGLNIPELLRMSIVDLERSPDAKYKLVHQGEPQVIPTLDSKLPFKINFIVATTNCSKDVNLDTNPFQCYINTEIPSKACHSFIWLNAETRFVRYINAKCTPRPRSKRSISDPANLTLDNLEIQKMVTASLEKLEMSSLHRYKQRILQINSHSTKITSGKVTTIDFDVGYTSCLKYEWIENITSCDFLEHLPRRRCVAQIWERLWISNGKNIDVNCVDDETPLESHIEFESAEMANELARESLRHIEAKYPHPNKQKVVRIFSLEKQVVAGIHYRMKVEVGLTDCVALSDQTECKFLKNQGLNKFCRVNVWVRPWTDHPPNFRVSCDFQEGSTHDFYHHVQAEHLFYHFLTTYSPNYENDYSQMQKRFEIFKNNIKKIHDFNIHEKGTAIYGVTRFADLTYEEFSSGYMGLKTNLSDANQIPMKKADIPDIKIPSNFDWRDYDAVTEVKDQGSCGSCWAFSVTGNIEGQWKMQSGQLVSLSEQELVDCDTLDEGCNGGLPDNAYRAIEQLGGLELESDYPYEGEDEKCVFNKTMAKVQINGAVNITTNETGMAQWLVHNGPISIGINANAMQFYMGGISHPWKMLCNPSNLDHGVLIVGYGIKDYPLFHKQLPYWIVKNSWGKSWGEQGYYRVYRGDGTCGVNQMASSAFI